MYTQGRNLDSYTACDIYQSFTTTPTFSSILFSSLDHCAMKELGLQYNKERSDYERMARLWTKNFAC